MHTLGRYARECIKQISHICLKETYLHILVPIKPGNKCTGAICILRPVDQSINTDMNGLMAEAPAHSLIDLYCLPVPYLGT